MWVSEWVLSVCWVSLCEWVWVVCEYLDQSYREHRLLWLLSWYQLGLCHTAPSLYPCRQALEKPAHLHLCDLWITFSDNDLKFLVILQVEQPMCSISTTACSTAFFSRVATSALVSAAWLLLLYIVTSDSLWVYSSSSIINRFLAGHNVVVVDLNIWDKHYDIAV